jgi:hypothetical protein
MKKFNATLKDKSTYDKLVIQISYKPVDANKITFNFGNSSKSLERTDLEFLDDNLGLVNPISTKIINPIKREKLQTEITKNKPFIYEVTGTIERNGEDILIDLNTAQYSLKINERYYIQLRYLGYLSNKIEIQF